MNSKSTLTKQVKRGKQIKDPLEIVVINIFVYKKPNKGTHVRGKRVMKQIIVSFIKNNHLIKHRTNHKF
jgi:hypothetical protein